MRAQQSLRLEPPAPTPPQQRPNPHTRQHLCHGHVQIDSHDGAYHNCWGIGGRSSEQGEQTTLCKGLSVCMSWLQRF